LKTIRWAAEIICSTPILGHLRVNENIRWCLRKLSLLIKTTFWLAFAHLKNLRFANKRVCVKIIETHGVFG
jgi:hypothetical protein